MLKKLFGVISSLVLLSGCGSLDRQNSAIIVTSTDFREGEQLPRAFTCDGDNSSPELMWSTIPAKTQSFTLIAHDPDAPQKVFTHWVLFNIPPTLTKLDRALSEERIASWDAIQGMNDFGKVGYAGACPPQGNGDHHYIFTLYALDVKLDLKPGASRQEVLKAQEEHVIGSGTLTALYKRSGV